MLTSAYAVWGAGALTALVGKDRIKPRLSSNFLLIGSVLLIVGVLTGWPHHVTWTMISHVQLLFTPLEASIDPLSSIFLLLLGTISAAVALFSPGYLESYKGRIQPGLYWFSIYSFVTAMSLVILSANAITFLVFWEIMSISGVALVVAEHKRRRAQKAALIYLGISRVSVTFLIAGFIWFHYLSGSWSFSDWHCNQPGMLMPSILVFIGLAIKTGLWPFHSWMPYIYESVPAPVAVLLSGLKIKVAIYAMIRLLVLSGAPNEIFAFVLLTLGTISAIWGILFALVQSDLRRLLAYSSVENVGLIVIGLALAMLCQIHGLWTIATLALAAAILHSLNHGVFKSLLFMNVGSIEKAVNSTDLGSLGGLSKRMPWTLACFFIAAVSIIAMPPFNGFVSKWLLYQSIFQLSFQSHLIVDRIFSFAVVGILSLIGAMSVACFAKAIGISFLGRPRSEAVTNAHEISTGMIVPQVALAVLCILSGVFASDLIAFFDPVLRGIAPAAASVALAQQPCNVLATLPTKFVASVGLLLILLFYLSVLNRKEYALRQFSTWDCGYGNLPSRAEETGSSFSQPIAIMFRPLLQYKVINKIVGKDKRHFPELIDVKSSMVPIIEQYLYRPSIAAFGGASRILGTLQTGSIHVHLLYVFLTILLLICIGTQL